ncbi:MAG: transporter substrate-binding domain-containing protein, partial [Spirochaetales bacterium]|nr:transporter substrate-binding domain-containing protein [Spirochaetales bacterium]
QIIQELQSMEGQNQELHGAMDSFQTEQAELGQELKNGSVRWEECDDQIEASLERLKSISGMVEKQSLKTVELNSKTELLLKKQEQNMKASGLMEISLKKEDEILGLLTGSNTSLKARLDNYSSSETSSVKNLKIGHDLAYPPWVYLHQGESTGISVDYAKKIGTAMGIKTAFEAGQWAELIEKLNNGEIDLIANVGWPNDYISEEEYCVSLPYASFEVCYFKNNGESTGRESSEASKVFFQKGSYVSEYIGGECETESEENDILNFVQLIWQKADRVITDRSVGEYISENYFSGQISAEKEDRGNRNVVFLCSRKNRELMDGINRAISALGPARGESGFKESAALEVSDPELLLPV